MKFDFTPYTHTDIPAYIDDTVFRCVLDQGFLHRNIVTEGPHTHLSYELHTARSGEYDVLVNRFSAVFPIRYGSILIIPPECPHYSEKKDAQPEQVCMYPIRFTVAKNGRTEGRLYRLIGEALPKPGDRPLYLQDTACCSLLDSLSRELRSGSIGSMQLAEAYLTLFWGSLLRQIIDPQQLAAGDPYPDPDTLKRKDSTDARIDKICAVIDSSYNQPLTVRTMSELLNLSPRQVNRFFSAHFGKSFRTVLTEQRMRRAEKLLLSGRIPIEQIAPMVGYSSPSAFFTVFKKHFRMTPFAYRSQYGGGTPS